MNRPRRRLLINTLLMGLLLSLLVVFFDQMGLLTSLERWAYDRRARDCQLFTPAPTKDLVHLDIDDTSLEPAAIGRWPWPRSRFAEIVDELKVAGPKAVAFDIILPDPEPITYEAVPNATPGADGLIPSKPVDGDAVLAAAIKRLGCAIVPVDISLEDPANAPPASKAMHDLLWANPQLQPDAILAGMTNHSILKTDAADAITVGFVKTRAQVIYEHILEYARTGTPTLEAARAKLLPADVAELDIDSPLSRTIANGYLRYQERAAVERLAPSRPADSSKVLMAQDLQFAPVPVITNSASAVGFVSVLFFSEDAVRTMPIVVDVGGKLYPQYGLALACRMLDVDPSSLRVTDRSVIIPRSGGRDIVIPTRTQFARTRNNSVPQAIDIPWFGTADWQTMYDYPAHVAKTQHVSIGTLWDVCVLRRRIAEHDRSIDLALMSMLGRTEALEYEAKRPPVEDIDARIPMLKKSIADNADLLKDMLAGDPATLDADGKQFIVAAKAMPGMLKAATDLRDQLIFLRGSLKKALGGKALLVGWTATAASADFVATPLHTKCPGVVVHGALFNAIMTGRFWRRAPEWVTPFLTILLGLITALAAAILPPVRAATVAILLLVGYLLINGLVLFGYWGIVVRVSPPLVAIGIVWAVVTLVRVIVEGMERALITRRFSTYADTLLVNYVTDHPDMVKFEGQKKELTVVFTDLQGFTTLSEKLGEQSVTLLNEYMSVMVPIIRKNRGYVNKFLGDGIMFFFGAPFENKNHAAIALQTVLEMQEAMPPFNARLAAAGLPQLVMRAGISTGNMIVGDAGSTDRSDYTVLGDIVNLGSRLESGNKAVGTRVLASGRTVELGGEGLLLRPLGNFCYMGKSEGVATYEVICRLTDAKPPQHRQVEITREMVAHFVAGRFEECLAAIAKVEAEFGSGKLTRMHAELCTRYLEEGAPAGFIGNIVLSEK